MIDLEINIVWRREFNMRTIGSIVIMVLAAVIGLLLGSFLGNPVGGMILLAVISGIACIIYTLDNPVKKD